MTIANVLTNTNFQNTRKLYGRNKEVEVLENIFERTCSGHSGIIMVTGYPGTGKTALINGVIKPLALKRGYLGGGKCDQFNSGVPYAALIQAFEEIVAQILTESRESYDAWRKKLLQALGPNGALITEVIPRFKLIIGSQPPVETLQPIEAQNRFRLVFQRLLQVFSAEKHPLVIFLDDLQWADPASLELIRCLSGDLEQGYLLLAGTYRDNVVTEAHPLAASMDALRQTGMNMQELALDHLSIDDTCSFIAGMLHSTESRVEPLAEQLYRRTGGNPLFLGQILKLLQDEGILKYDSGEGCWEWDMSSLLKLEIPEDVVTLMTVKLQRLPEESRNLVKMAACIGNSFDLRTLSIACEKDKITVRSGLQPPILAGLILPRAETEPGREVYDFLHDRIHQATYSLISEIEKKELHLKLGRLLLRNTSREDLDEAIILIMDHCNRGLDLIEDASERVRMAACNLTAARKSKNATAYHSAREFFKAGIALLPDDAWLKHYQLAFDLHLDCSLCEYLAGNPAESDRHSDLVLKYAGTNQELSGIYSLKMLVNAGMGNLGEAVALGMKALGLLGMNLPARPGKLVLLKDILLVKWLMFSRKTVDLLYMPEMSDPMQKEVMKLMSLLGPIAYITNPDLSDLLILKETTLTLKFGNSEMSAIAYGVYAAILGDITGDYKTGQAFEKLSITLAEKYSSSSAKCRAYFIAGAMVSHWTQPGRVSNDYLLKSVRYGIESGELLYTGYALYVSIEEQYQMGTSLMEVDQECRKWYGFARQMKLNFLLAALIIYRQLARTLGGQKEDAFALSMGDEYENNFVEKVIQSDKMIAMRRYFSRMQLYYLFGRHEDALAMADKMRENLPAFKGFMISGAYRFYHSLVITAVYTKLPGKSRWKYWGILKNNLRQIKKWSDLCPENYLQQYLLLSAEIARLSGKNQEAMSLYDQAITSAREHGYIQIAAIAAELAGRFYLAIGRDRIGQVYLNDALHLFEKWGAYAKSKALQQEFPLLLPEMTGEDKFYEDIEEFHEDSPVLADGDGSSVLVPDAGPIQKVQHIIRKRNPEKQLEDFLDVIFEYADADKGFLILESNRELYIEAVKDGIHNPTTMIEAVPTEKSTNLSRMVVRYVARTQEIVVLRDGGQGEIFFRDPYLEKNRPKSLLCLPVLIQGILAGVLYLECSLEADVFTPQRQETTKQLCSQMEYVEKLQDYFKTDTAGDTDRKSWPALDALTNRELEVLELIAAGMSNKEIAQKLGLSSNTIKMHQSNIYGKLQVKRRVQAVNRAKELGMLKTIKT